MTDALHARALALARQFAAESLCRGEAWLPGVKAGIHEEIIAGKHDSEPLVQSALAAILATTERAASYAETQWVEANDPIALVVSFNLRNALRSGAHLKEPTS